jgi:hypothetical protein
VLTSIKEMVGVKSFIENEYRSFELASRQGDVNKSWNHLQRIHIASQYNIKDHFWSHYIMLCYAVKVRSVKEVFGQVLRLFFTPFGHLFSRIPIGNRGTSDVSPFAKEYVPDDIVEVLKENKNDL